MTQVYIESLGCAKNRVDTETMLGTLLAHSFVHTGEPNQAEVIIVNTCGFLTSAVEESIERILSLSRYKKTGACKKLIVVGCMAERYRKTILEDLPEIDGVLGTSDYREILSCVSSAMEREERLAYFQKRPKFNVDSLETARILTTNRHYAYLKIAEGCSNMCSFCNIPKLRGYFQSRSIPQIRHEFLGLLENGIKEINLISQDTSSYGLDLQGEQNLLSLINTLLQSSNKEFWIRLFYSYPNRFPLDLFDVMRDDPRLANYLDMPFQHISNPVLEAMNRRITSKEIRKIIEAARSKVPELSFRTTFIVGFPNESEANFQELLAFVEEGHFDHLGIFTYSDEDNIVSSKMRDPVSEEIKIERRDRIMAAQQQILEEKNRSKVGRSYKVLIEGPSDQTDLLLQGRTQHQGVDVDGLVYINEGNARAGDFHLAEITEAHPYDLVGKIIQ